MSKILLVIWNKRWQKSAKQTKIQPSLLNNGCDGMITETITHLPIYGDIDLGSVVLESGKQLDTVSLRFEQVGNPEAPVVLVCHALTGNHETVGGFGREGWWSGLIGPKRFIDTNKYQVITFNALGSCYGSTGPASINPKTKKRYQSDFPFFTVRDMAKVQKLALDQLGLADVEIVIGGSLGGMQALELAFLYPDRFKKVVSLAATPFLSDYGIAFNYIGRKAITDDPDWQNGNYRLEKRPQSGLSTARMLAMLTYRSQELYNDQFHREDRDGWGASHTETAFQVESYLNYQGRKLVERFDPNSYLYLLKAMDSHDIGRGRGGWEKAIASIKADLLAVGFKGDLIYPSENILKMAEIHQLYNKNTTFFEVETRYGHDGFLVEFEKWGGKVREWLNGV
ncbi:MAG: homoserine O-acetyltransferase MetX [Tuberibacillus sp.]